MTYCPPTLSVGDIVLCEITYTDYTSAKIRPVLIISTKDYDLGADDVIIAKITSKVAPSRPYAVLLDDQEPEFTCTGLKCSSAIDCTMVLTVSQTLLKRRLGKLSPAKLDSVRDRLRKVFDL